MLFILKSRKKKKKIGVKRFQPFNPLTFDAGNLVALYDGDVGLDSFTWADQGGGAYDIVFANSPTYTANAQNGHASITFDGASQNGAIATPTTAVPFTSYYVFRDITHVGNRYVKDDGVNVIGDFIRLQTPSNNIYYANNTSGNLLSPGFVLNRFDILTVVVNSGVNGQAIRVNNNAAVLQTNGAPIARNGLTIGSRADNVAYSNCEFLYIIMRTGADSTATQDKFINFFKARFAI